MRAVGQGVVVKRMVSFAPEQFELLQRFAAERHNGNVSGAIRHLIDAHIVVTKSGQALKPDATREAV